MPETQTLKRSTPDLAIHVEGPTHFTPGDTISGTVDRASHFVNPHANVTLTLHGRVHATVKRSPNDVTDYESEFSLFDTRATTLTLWDGPVHVEEGGDPASWPFVINIPPFVHPGTSRWSRELDKTSYEPLDVGQRPLPDTFAFNSSGLTYGLNTFVEYYLEAKLAVTHRGAWSTEEATMPVVLRTLHPGPPIDHFDGRLQRCYRDGRFLSHRLLPGCENMRLSSSQKMQRLFHSRHIPSLAVEYVAETPDVIQLDNPTPVPFFLRARPKWELTSDILQNVPQKIRVDWVRADLISHTEAKALGALKEHAAAGDMEHSLGNCTWTHGSPVHLPFLPNDPPLNLGELMDLRVGQDPRFRRAYRRRIYPSFTAFNIKHTRHNLWWTVGVSIAGEKNEIDILKPVKILPPACDGPGARGDESQPPPPFVARRTESWAKPPPDADAPPAYCPPDGAQGDGPR